MYILAVETTGKYGSAAVIDENGKCWTAANSETMNHLKDILLLTDDCMKQAGIEKNQLTHVAASIGPGSFTGIRIGVTTARAIGQVMSIPCVAVSSLEGMAESAKKHAGDADYIVAIINARRHQTYAGMWRVEDGALAEVLPQKQYIIEEMLEEIRGMQGRFYFIGDGIDAYEKAIEERMPEGSYVLAEEAVRYQTAETVAEIALRKAVSDQVLEYSDLLPNYMRKSEAEMRLEAGTLSRKIHG